jgi:hypothetical protein
LTTVDSIADVAITTGRSVDQGLEYAALCQITAINCAFIVVVAGHAVTVAATTATGVIICAGIAVIARCGIGLIHTSGCGIA